MVFVIHQYKLALGLRVTPPPPPFPPHPSRLSHSTDFACPASYIKLPLAIYFTYGNVYVSVLCSQIIWLVSFSIMPSRFIHVIKNGRMSFF